MLLYRKNYLEFDYTHIIKPKLKNIYIQVSKNGEVILKSSPYRKKEAVKLLEQKKEWVIKSVEKVKNRVSKENRYINEGSIFYLGKKYPLFFYKQDCKKTYLLFDKKEFKYFYKDTFIDCEKRVEEFYKKEAKKIFNDRIKLYSDKLSLYPKEIKFRKTKRRLVCCMGDNTLSFNYLCVKLALEEIDYIIVHELSHIKHKNHSKEFWKQVAKEFPDFKKIRSFITL